jgi:hypothetical protein
MIDIDGYLRSKNLPTWDFNHVRALANKICIKKDVPSFLELYIASPDRLQGSRPIDDERGVFCGHLQLGDA